MLAAVALGAGYGVYFAIDQALVTEILPRENDRGRRLGAMNTAGSGAVAAAPLIAAPIIPAAGFSPLSVVAACLAIAAACSCGPSSPSHGSHSCFDRTTKVPNDHFRDCRVAVRGARPRQRRRSTAERHVAFLVETVGPAKSTLKRCSQE
jgi:MFS family permease